MRIPEYTQRLSLDLGNTGQTRLQEPAAFSDTSNIERMGRQLTNTASELAQVYVDMKNERDKGIVNEFMNEFSVAKAQKLQELKQQYKGANAESIIAAYKDWQDDYYNARLGMNREVSDDTLFLENDEQIKNAKNQLSRDWANTVNTLSTYAGNELETYKKNQFSARMEMLITGLSAEDDLNNIQNTIDNIAYNMGENYAGQSPEYIAMKTRQLVNSGMATNVMQSINSNPAVALAKLSNPLFKDTIEANTFDELKVNAMKSFVNYEATNLAANVMAGAENKYVWDDQQYEGIKGIVDEFGKDYIANQIELEASKKYKVRATKENTAKRVVDNSYFTKLFGMIGKDNDPMLSPNERETNFAQMTDLLAEGEQDQNKREIATLTVDEVNRYLEHQEDLKELEALTTVADPEAAIRTAYNLSTSQGLPKPENIDTVIKQGQTAIQKQEDNINKVENEIDRYSEVMSRVQSGAISDIRDIDLKSFTPESSIQLMGAFAEAQNEVQFINYVKQTQGLDVNKIMDNAFNAYFQSNARFLTPVIYNTFKQNFRDMFMREVADNKGVITEERLNALLPRVYNQTISGDEKINTLLSLEGAINDARKDSQKSFGYPNQDDIMQRISSLPEFSSYTTEELQKLMNYLSDGSVIAADKYLDVIEERNRLAQQESWFSRAINFIGGLF